MRYITNADGYIVTVSFGADVECEHGVCTEYEGGVPIGYASLDAWYVSEGEKLHRWKVVEGELTKDEAAAAPKEKNVFDLIYPVGSIYMSVSPVSPATLFGGTWEQIRDTFLLAAGINYEAGTTGGEAEHTLTVEELPSHNHYVPNIKLTGSDSGQAYAESWGGGSGSRDIYTENAGGGEPHNNMPPYLAVYMWKRVEDPVPGDPDIPDEPDSGLAITDDGAGNVTIAAYGSASITYDGEGNVTIADSGSTSITDDGAGNVTIL